MPLPSREVTLALVRYRTPLAAASLPRAINSDTALVAASPAYETARLLTVFGAGVDLIRAFAWLLVAASTLMLFVGARADARRAPLRPRDHARAGRVAAAGGARSCWRKACSLRQRARCWGSSLAHAAAAAIGWWLPQAAPLCGGGPPLPAGGVARGRARGMAAGIIAALWPAWRAYRLDVAATLAEG